MKEELKIKDKKVPLPHAFIKFGKKEYMEKYVLDGELRFSPALDFQNMPSENNDIADNHEAHLFYPVQQVYIAELIDEENSIYGKPIKLAETANMRETNNTISKIPFHCLYCYNKPVINNLLKLENYEELISGLKDYDTAVIILYPNLYIDTLKKSNNIYFNHIIYTDRTPLFSELDNNCHQLFYKRQKFNNQKEFRIALPTMQVNEAFNLQVGNLSNIAFTIPISMLKNGVIVAESKEKLEEILNLMNKSSEDKND